MKRTQEDLRKLAVIRQTLAQNGSPCSRCKRKICNDPCIPQRDWFRAPRKKTPMPEKPRPVNTPAVNATADKDPHGNQ